MAYAAAGTLEERTAKCQTTYSMDTDEYVPNNCIYTPATAPDPLPDWMSVLPFEGMQGYSNSWATTEDFIRSTGGTADQYLMAKAWRDQIDADVCSNIWPSTGTSDTIRLHLDTAGVSNVAGVYHHEVRLPPLNALQRCASPSYGRFVLSPGGDLCWTVPAVPGRHVQRRC
jgi:hypothetical protein